MTKDEILAKSRQENKITDKDEREQSIEIKAGNLAGTVSLLLCIMFMFVNTIQHGPEVVTYSLWAVYWCRQAVVYGYQAYHLKKRSYWFYSAVLAVTCLVHAYGFFRSFPWG